MNTKIIGGIVAALVLITIGFLLLRPEAEAPTLSDPATAERTFVEYVNEGDTARVQVGYRGDTVLLNGLSFSEEILERVETASGVRYQNADNSIAFWTKGDEATIYVNDEAIFTGMDSSVIQEPVPETSDTEGVADTAASSTLSGTWTWVESTLAGETITASTSSEFTLTFGADGRVTGTTDCNNFSGSYTETDGTITFSPLAMTRMFCEGSLETEFTSPLTDTMSYTITGTTLVLTSGNNSVTLTEN